MFKVTRIILILILSISGFTSVASANKNASESIRAMVEKATKPYLQASQNYDRKVALFEKLGIYPKFEYRIASDMDAIIQRLWTSCSELKSNLGGFKYFLNETSVQAKDTIRGNNIECNPFKSRKYPGWLNKYNYETLARNYTYATNEAVRPIYLKTANELLADFSLKAKDHTLSPLEASIALAFKRLSKNLVDELNAYTSADRIVFRYQADVETLVFSILEFIADTDANLNVSYPFDLDLRQSKFRQELSKFEDRIDRLYNENSILRDELQRNNRRSALSSTFLWGAILKDSSFFRNLTM